MFPASQRSSAFSKHNNIPSELDGSVTSKYSLSIVGTLTMGARITARVIYSGDDTEILFYDNEKKPTLTHIKEVESYISYKEHFPLPQRVSCRLGWP